jgi:hypothetical protein
MIWARIIAAILDLIKQFQQSRHDAEVKSAGAAEVVKEIKEKVAQDVSVAEAARSDVRRELDAQPSSLRDDDGYRRD